MVVSTVFPFRTNSYIVDELIDWDDIPDDPIFRLTFPHRDMLNPDDYRRMSSLISQSASRELLKREANLIRLKLNPHPAGQLTHNQAVLKGRPLAGVQHKYKQTVLHFPGQAQTCHAFCTFCFRWAQFVGIPDLRIASKGIQDLVDYLRCNEEVSDVLLTGGDPMIMSADLLEQHIDALLESGLDHIQNIRIGTKSLAYWPHKYVSDPDADRILLMFERVAASGRQLALMAHYDHPAELSTSVARRALRRVLDAGARVRVQAPLVRHINDDPDVWAELWSTAARLGATPYYMFIQRDTGAKQYFEVPLVNAWHIYRQAIKQVSGLSRTVRGPSMSATPGKIRVIGVSDISGHKVFVLEYLQARDLSLVGRPFFAKFDPRATWFDDLEPAFPGYERFFETDDDDDDLPMAASD